LQELDRQGLTMPSLGLITKQTIAGAMATGTHGSGRHSLSHYLHSAKIAHYRQESNEPVLQTVDRDNELLAARCALGSLGIVTSITIPVIPQFQIEEHFAHYRTLDAVLAAEEQFPLQQFYFAPWRWDYFAQHRRAVPARRSWSASAYRLYWTVGMDRAFHWLILGLVRLLPFSWTKFFFRQVLGSLIPMGWKVVDRSDRQLTMQHQLFRHIEIELFVTRSQLPEAIDFVKWLMRLASGEPDSDDGKWKDALSSTELVPEIQSLRGQYRHHYPICIRKVLADETLISMASGNEDYYAISLISYARPSQRRGFELFAQVIASCMAKRFRARPHWGKHCPLPAEELRKLYPNFQLFLDVKKQFDSNAVFDNSWTEQLFTQP
jgi:FAD/FMN-containing dehydrogenase